MQRGVGQTVRFLLALPAVAIPLAAAVSAAVGPDPFTQVVAFVPLFVLVGVPFAYRVSRGRYSLGRLWAFVAVAWALMLPVTLVDTVATNAFLALLDPRPDGPVAFAVVHAVDLVRAVAGFAAAYWAVYEFGFGEIRRRLESLFRARPK